MLFPFVTLAQDLTTKDIVKQFSLHLSVADRPVFVAIAYCESQFNELAKNPYSSASGVFQILKGTWSDYKCTGDRFSAIDNAACAVKIFKDSGSQPWDASKTCWNN